MLLWYAEHELEIFPQNNELERSQKRAMVDLSTVVNGGTVSANMICLKIRERFDVPKTLHFRVVSYLRC